MATSLVSTGITFPDATTQTTALPAPSTSGNVLTSNGTAWTSAAPSQFSNTQTFTSSGTWTKPGSGTYAFVRCWGGGGGGGKATGSSGGGGGGGFTCKTFKLSDLGATETVTIGAGGAGATVATTDGGAGGNTSFGSTITTPSIVPGTVYYLIDGGSTTIANWNLIFNSGTTYIPASGGFGSAKVATAGTGIVAPFLKYIQAGGGGGGGSSTSATSVASTIGGGGGFTVGANASSTNGWGNQAYNLQVGQSSMSMYDLITNNSSWNTRGTPDPAFFMTYYDSIMMGGNRFSQRWAGMATVLGGATGGSLADTGATVVPVGTTVFGGAGGASSYASSGSNGTAPGGGGGATGTGASAGTGGAGRVEVYVW